MMPHLIAAHAVTAKGNLAELGFAAISVAIHWPATVASAAATAPSVAGRLEASGEC